MLGFLLSRMWFVKIHGSDISIGNCARTKKTVNYQKYILIKYRLKVLKVVIAKTKIGESMSVQMICFLHNYMYKYKVMQVSFKLSSGIFSPCFNVTIKTEFSYTLA